VHVQVNGQPDRTVCRWSHRGERADKLEALVSTRNDIRKDAVRRFLASLRNLPQPPTQTVKVLSSISKLPPLSEGTPVSPGLLPTGFRARKHPPVLPFGGDVFSPKKKNKTNPRALTVTPNNSIRR
jgi:hypothetical protein